MVTCIAARDLTNQSQRTPVPLTLSFATNSVVMVKRSYNPDQLEVVGMKTALIIVELQSMLNYVEQPEVMVGDG